MVQRGKLIDGEFEINPGLGLLKAGGHARQRVARSSKRSGAAASLTRQQRDQSPALQRILEDFRSSAQCDGPFVRYAGYKTRRFEFALSLLDEGADDEY